MTHCRSAFEKCRPRWIDGSATFTIVASKMTMNCARQTITRTSQRLVERGEAREEAEYMLRIVPSNRSEHTGFESSFRTISDPPRGRCAYRHRKGRLTRDHPSRTGSPGPPAAAEHPA